MDEGPLKEEKKSAEADQESVKEEKKLDDAVEESESEEHEHEDGMQYEEIDILGLPKACDALLNILPQVFPEDWPKKSPKVLYHHDISANNILVDDAGNLVGLVDWENILTVPYALADPYPPVLQSKYGERSSLLNGTPPCEGGDDDSKKIYDEMYEKKLLQEEFRTRLEELHSPWLRTFKEATVLIKENLAGIAFRHPRTLEWIEGLAGREDLGLPADVTSR